MKGDEPELAAKHGRYRALLDRAAQPGEAELVVCPSYYSDDPVLERRVFGARPEELSAPEQFGARLDPSDPASSGPARRSARARVQRRAIWKRIAALSSGRKPFLWDNYPVNAR